MTMILALIHPTMWLVKTLSTCQLLSVEGCCLSLVPDESHSHRSLTAPLQLGWPGPLLKSITFQLAVDSGMQRFALVVHPYRIPPSCAVFLSSILNNWVTLYCFVGRRTASWIHFWPYQWHTGQGRGKRPSGHARSIAEAWRNKQLYRSVWRLQFTWQKCFCLSFSLNRSLQRLKKLNILFIDLCLFMLQTSRR